MLSQFLCYSLTQAKLYGKDEFIRGAVYPQFNARAGIELIPTHVHESVLHEVPEGGCQPAPHQLHQLRLLLIAALQRGQQRRHGQLQPRTQVAGTRVVKELTLYCMKPFPGPKNYDI